MKGIIGFLAAAALFTGCGVGMNDPEGMAAASSSSALIYDANGNVIGTTAGTTTRIGNLYLAPAAPTGTGTQGGDVSAPQDPIPFRPGDPIPIDPNAAMCRQTQFGDPQHKCH
jgi:hypothetical protein